MEREDDKWFIKNIHDSIMPKLNKLKEGEKNFLMMGRLLCPQTLRKIEDSCNATSVEMQKMRREIPAPIFDILLNLMYPGEISQEQNYSQIKDALTEKFTKMPSESGAKFASDVSEIFAQLTNYPTAKKAICETLEDPEFLENKYDDWNRILMDRGLCRNMIKAIQIFDKDT